MTRAMTLERLNEMRDRVISDERCVLNQSWANELLDEVERLREVSLETAMNDAARDLPDGWKIRFTVEPGYGLVELGHDDDDSEDWIPFELDDPQESFASVVRHALARALEVS